MDRLSGHIENVEPVSDQTDASAFEFGGGDEHLVEEHARRREVDPQLFELAELEVVVAGLVAAGALLAGGLDCASAVPASSVRPRAAAVRVFMIDLLGGWTQQTIVPCQCAETLHCSGVKLTK